MLLGWVNSNVNKLYNPRTEIDHYLPNDTALSYGGKN